MTNTKKITYRVVTVRVGGFIQAVPKEATIQIQISALIQTTYCNALKFIIVFK